MSLVMHKIGSRVDAEAFLRGALISGPISQTLFVHGLTLIFTAPASETVTFAASPASAQVPLDIPTVISQIEAQTTGIVVKPIRTSVGTRLVIEEAIPTPGGVGVAITGAGTANALLGFGDSALTGTVYNAPDGLAPRLVCFTTAPDNPDNFLIVTDI